MMIMIIITIIAMKIQIRMIIMMATTTFCYKLFNAFSFHMGLHMCARACVSFVNKIFIFIE